MNLFVYLYHKYKVVFVVKMLDNSNQGMYNNSCLFKSCADIAQAVECILGKDEVTGSNPVISSKAPRTISSWGLLLTYYLFTLTSNVLGALGSNK